MLYALLGIAAAFLLFLTVLLVRTLTFRPLKEETAEKTPEEFDADASIDALAQLIRCATVSRHDKSLEDEAEFEKFKVLLPRLYPKVFEACELVEFPDRGLLFRWRGRNEGEPAVLMAHYDVVPADAEKWEKPPFCGEIENGVLWGRGALDTKVTFNGVLFSANKLIAEGFVPQRDIYFAFSGGEEINGKGAVHIVSYLKEKGITPAFVLDEGGAVVENVFPGVSAPCALIGIAEKGMMDVEYSVASAGGHASAPKPHTPVGVLSRAVCRVEGHPFKKHLTPPVAKMFDTLGRHSNFFYRLLFANLWCFAPLLDLICKKSGGEINALMRTTVAFTQMSGSDAPNVIPPSARVVSNIRLNPKDTVDSALSYLQKTVKDESVKLSVLRGMNPSRISSVDCEGYEKVKRAITSTWCGSIVSPYLMVQCSDSRHYGVLSDRVYRFSAMDLTSEERGTIHGNNERIRIECVNRATEFYLRLMKNC